MIFIQLRPFPHLILRCVPQIWFLLCHHYHILSVTQFSPSSIYSSPCIILHNQHYFPSVLFSKMPKSHRILLSASRPHSTSLSSTKFRNYATKKKKSIPSITSLSRESFKIENVSVSDLEKRDPTEATFKRVPIPVMPPQAEQPAAPKQSGGTSLPIDESLLDENAIVTQQYEQMFTPATRVPPTKPITVQAHRVPEVIDIMEGRVDCPGCGVTLQTKREDAIGFIHPKALQTYMDEEKSFREVATIMKNKKSTTVLSKAQIKSFERFSKKKHSLTCQRCHNLANYKIVHDVPMKDFTEKLRVLKGKDVLVLYVVDIFDLENSFIENLTDIIGEKDVILVVNKTDLIPSNTDEDLLEVQVRRIAKPHLMSSTKTPSAPNGTPMSTLKDVILLSAWSKRNFKQLGAAIERHRHYRDVYIIGKTNVGKSTLTNSLVKYFGGSIVKEGEEDPASTDRGFARVTESEYPGTTLNNISLLIGGGQNSGGLKQRMFDTPGLKNDNLIISYLDPVEWRCVYPRKKISPRFVAAAPGKSLFIGGLIRIDFISNQVFQKQFEKVTFVVYTSNMMPVHLTRTDKADELYENRVGDFLFPPAKSNTKVRLNAYTDFTFESDTRKQNCGDIALPGFGWVSVNGAGKMRIRVHHPRQLKVTQREALLPKACEGVSPKEYETDHDFNRYKLRMNMLHKKEEMKKERKVKREIKRRIEEV